MLRFVLHEAEGADVVGTLTIGDVSPIVVEGAYLDSWLLGLLEALSTLNAGATRHEVDLIEEPSSLVATNAGGILVLQFGGQATTLGPTDAATDRILANARDFLARYQFAEVLTGDIEEKLRLIAGAVSSRDGRTK